MNHFFTFIIFYSKYVYGDFLWIINSVRSREVFSFQKILTNNPVKYFKSFQYKYNNLYYFIAKAYVSPLLTANLSGCLVNGGGDSSLSYHFLISSFKKKCS